MARSFPLLMSSILMKMMLEIRSYSLLGLCKKCGKKREFAAKLCVDCYNKEIKKIARKNLLRNLK